MEISNRILVLGVGIFAVLWLMPMMSPAVSAQMAPTSSPSDSPSQSSPPSDCMTSILNMSDCLTFVEAGSNLTIPEKNCCPEFAGLVESNPICLCQLLGNMSSFGIELDVNKGLTLPKVCKVDTPPVSVCSAIGVPVSVPPSSQGPVSPGPGGAGGVGGAPLASEALPPSPRDKNSGTSTTDTRSASIFFLLSLSSAILTIFFF